jgi:hypothetical protein
MEPNRPAGATVRSDRRLAIQRTGSGAHPQRAVVVFVDRRDGNVRAGAQRHRLEALAVEALQPAGRAHPQNAVAVLLQRPDTAVLQPVGRIKRARAPAADLEQAILGADPETFPPLPSTMART